MSKPQPYQPPWPTATQTSQPSAILRDTGMGIAHPLRKSAFMALIDKAKHAYYRQLSKRIYAKHVLPAIDIKRFEQLQAKWGASDKTVYQTGYSKYFALEDYCLRDISRALWLGLSGNRPRRNILDMGCGMGYFPFICRQYGHSVTGLDLNESQKYADVIECLRINRVIFRVEPFKPLPQFPSQFDLVTAFQMTFNGHGTSCLWGVEQWRFFLNDMQQHLLPGSRIVLQFQESNSDPRHLEVLSFLGSLGARFRGPFIVVPRS